MLRLLFQVLEALSGKLCSDDLLQTMSNQKTTSKFITMRIEEIVKEFMENEDLRVLTLDFEEGIKSSEIKISSLESQSQKYMREVTDLSGKLKSLQMKNESLQNELQTVKEQSESEIKLIQNRNSLENSVEISKYKRISDDYERENSSLKEKVSSLTNILQSVSLNVLGTKSFDKNCFQILEKIQNLKTKNKEIFPRIISGLKKGNKLLRSELISMKKEISNFKLETSKLILQSSKSFEKAISNQIVAQQNQNNIREREIKLEFSAREECLREELRGLKFQVSSLTKRNSIYSEEIENLSKNFSLEAKEKDSLSLEKESAISKLQEKNSQLVLQLQTKSGEISALKQEIKGLEASLDAIKSNSDSAASSVDKLASELQECKRRANSFEEISERLQMELELSKKSYKTSLQEIEKLNNLIQQQGEEFLEKESEYQIEIKGLKAKLQSLHEKHSKLESEILDFRDLQKNSSREIESIRKDNLRFREENNSLKSELSGFLSKFHELKELKGKIIAEATSFQSSFIDSQKENEREKEKGLMSQLAFLFEEISALKAKFHGKFLALQDKIERQNKFQETNNQEAFEILKEQNENLESQLAELISKYEILSKKREEEKQRLLSELENAYRKPRFSHQEKSSNSGNHSLILRENQDLRERIQELRQINNYLKAI